jgi:predicted signal transduction protein with EAL and GGDEF domain
VTQDAGGVFAEIAALSRTMNVIVFGGLAVLWLLLVPIVAAASRRLRRHAEAQEHEATHDELTGLPNRRALLGRLAGADPRATGLVVLDVDGFKAINTLFGRRGIARRARLGRPRRRQDVARGRRALRPRA